MELFEDIGKGCVYISGKHVVCNKVISARFHDMNLEDGMRHIVRIAGIENYALTYRNDLRSQYPVSQIFFFPSGGSRITAAILSGETNAKSVA